MTKKEFKRLNIFVKARNKHVEMFHGYVILHEDFAKKNDIFHFQYIESLKQPLNYPPEHIKKVSLWIKNHSKAPAYF